MSKSLALVVLCTFAVACNAAPKESAPSPVGSAAPEIQGAAPQIAALHLGAPIEATATPARLADIAKDPHKYDKGTYATTGTVTAVCQHMGCWMEIKDDASEAHIKMAGHAFFVPKTASGKKAKVLAQVVVNDTEGSCADEPEGEMSTQAGAANPQKTAAADHDKPGDQAHEKHEKKGCRAEAEQQMGHPLAKLELVALGVELYD
jgi:hypothetical protein